MNAYPIAFYTFSAAAAPIWLLMIFAPRWPMTHKIIKSLWIVVPFMLAYAILEIPNALPDLPLLVRPHLPSIMKLLGTEPAATLAWLHFIAADLFVGRWVYLDSREHNMNVWLMGPILFFNSMLCPFGFVLYLIARKLTRPTAPMS